MGNHAHVRPTRAAGDRSTPRRFRLSGLSDLLCALRTHIRHDAEAARSARCVLSIGVAPLVVAAVRWPLDAARRAYCGTICPLVCMNEVRVGIRKGAALQISAGPLRCFIPASFRAMFSAGAIPSETPRRSPCPFLSGWLTGRTTAASPIPLSCLSVRPGGAMKALVDRQDGRDARYFKRLGEDATCIVRHERRCGCRALAFCDSGPGSVQ